MANKDLFEQAIADAKKLKEISMANAKQVIEEAFAPKIQEMFRLKLSEMDSLEEDDYTEDGMEGGMAEGTVDEISHESGEQKSEADMHSADDFTDSNLEEATLDEILAELELEEAEEPSMEGHDAEVMQEAKKEKEESEEEETEEEGEETEEVSEEGADEVAELSIEEFKNLIRDVVADVMGSHEAGAASEEGDLESADVVPGEEGGDETISLDEILAELEEESKDKVKVEEAEKEEHKEEDEKEKLEEAVKTINFLKSQLSEINLLNAKLLYVNKIFKAKSLTESQKVKVVTAFDRATTTKEAKNIYETLVDSLTSVAPSTKKAPIKESLGFASKPIGSAPATPIVEADAYVYRMQQLAGIKQPNI